MHGLHLTADLRQCAPGTAALTDPQALRALCLHAVAGSGLQAVAELFHRFPAPGGVTGVVLLAESHLAVHTWPELGAVTLDVYVCNLHADHSAKAEALMVQMEAAFAAAQVLRQRVVRGADPGPGRELETGPHAGGRPAPPRVATQAGRAAADIRT